MLRLVIIAAALAACAPLGGCVTAGSSAAADGQSTARRVDDQIGRYPGEFVANWVDTVGRRLVAQLGPTPYYFKFRVVDQAAPGAFATAGGYVFISRGLLALINSEDELAAILAHEISHVTERQRPGPKPATGAAMLTLPAPKIAAVLRNEITAIAGVPIGEAGTALRSAYDREQEAAADAAGMRLAAKAGYAPDALATLWANAGRVIALRPDTASGFGCLPGAEPAPQRAAKIAAAAADIRRTTPRPVLPDQAAVFRRLDGLTWGRDNPLQGVFRDAHFMQPGMRLSIDFPQGWRTLNTPGFVGAIAPDDTAAILFGSPQRTGDARSMAADFAATLGAAAGVPAQGPTRRQLEDGTAWVVTLDDASGAEPVSIYGVWIEAFGSVFRIFAFGPQRYRTALSDTAQSLRRVSNEELASIVVRRIRIAEAADGETLASLSARTGNVIGTGLTAAINGMPDLASLAPGQLLKIVREESYLGRHVN